MKRRTPLAPHALALLTLLCLASTVNAQRPEIVVPIGHTSYVQAVAFSPDGALVATGSTDQTIKLWDTATGRMLRTLTGHTGDVAGLGFVLEGKALVSAGGDKTVRVWDASTGRQLHKLEGHTDEIRALAVSPDRRTLATSGLDKTIRLWDAQTGRHLRTLKGHAGYIMGLAFAPDGRRLASAAWSGDGPSLKDGVRLWDTQTGECVRVIDARVGSPEAVAFSPDGKKVLAGGTSGVAAWDAATGNPLTVAFDAKLVESLAFSPDGQRLACGTKESQVFVWDAKTERVLHEFKVDGGYVVSLSFRPDGRALAANSGGDQSVFRLWDTETGRDLLPPSDTRAAAVNDAALSPDGRTLAVTQGDATARLWELTTGQGPRVFNFPGSLSGIAYLDDGKSLSVEERYKGSLLLWDAAAPSGAQPRQLPGGMLTPDGRLMLAPALSNKRDELALYESESAAAAFKERRPELLRAVRTFKTTLYRIQTATFSPDGRWLVLGGRGEEAKRDYDTGRAELWEVATGRRIHVFSGHTSEVAAIAFGPGARTFATASWDKTIKLWDAESGRLLHTLTGHTDWVTSVAFGHDGRTLASASSDGTARMWDTTSGKLLRTFEGHSSGVGSVVFAGEQGNLLATTGGDGTVRLWDVRTGTELARLVSFGPSDWLVITPEGLFDGTPSAYRQILWRYDGDTRNVAPVEWFFNEFYYPNLLADIFAGRRPTAPRNFLALDRRQPRIALTRADSPSTSNAVINTRAVKVRLQITEAAPDASNTRLGSGARDVRLFRNGSLVKVWRGDVLNGQPSTTLETTITLVAGENRITAYAFNRDNVKSRDAQLSLTGSDSLRRSGLVRVLAVGVNEYANRRYNLRYAVADAEEFAESVRREQKRLGRFAEVEVLALRDREATKANILKALASLSARTQPEDVVVVYFAGHGAAQGERFYLIPHDLGYAGAPERIDAAGLRTLLSRSISDVELESALGAFDASQLLLVIDACNSGQALEAEEKRRGPMNSKGLAQLAYEKGMYVLTAAQSHQAALEAARLGHGFLTYALVEEGLKKSLADGEPKDGQIVLREWLDYATARVPKMQLELMTEAQRTRGLPIFFLAGEDGIEDPSRRSVQRPRVFYRRDPDPQPLVIARP